MSDMYDADYYLRGRETGKSLYSDYRWLPELTIPMCQTIVDYCGIQKEESILDFGCARGYIVKALRRLGYNAIGTDTSKWAVENCDPEVNLYVHHGAIPKQVDWIIAKDVLEHAPYAADIIEVLMGVAQHGVFAVVPLSPVDDAPYVVPEYELDVTHIHRLTLATWVRYFLRLGWEVTASYRVPGIKDNYAQWEAGNGFITARRL